jgi:hypothetical protein
MKEIRGIDTSFTAPSISLLVIELFLLYLANLLASPASKLNVSVWCKHEIAKKEKLNLKKEGKKGIRLAKSCSLYT